MTDEYIPFIERKQKTYYAYTPRKFLLQKTNKSLRDEIHELYLNLKPEAWEIRLREWIIKKLSEVLGDLREYGSFSTGTFLPTSDLDLVIMNKTGESSTLDGAYNLLIAKEAVSSIIHLRNARIPVLRCTDAYFGLRIDIVSHEHAGLEHSSFIRHNLEMHRGLRMFCIVLKKFLKMRQLTDSRRGGLCSYAQFMLVYHFFKIHPLIQSNRIDPEENIDILFMDFFQYYGVTFNYRTINIKNSQYLPNDTDHLLSIIDMTQNDAGDKCSNMKAIKDVFMHAYKIMKIAMHEKKDSLLQLWIPHDESENRFRESLLRKAKIVFKNSDF